GCDGYCVCQQGYTEYLEWGAQVTAILLHPLYLCCTSVVEQGRLRGLLLIEFPDGLKLVRCVRLAPELAVGVTEIEVGRMIIGAKLNGALQSLGCILQTILPQQNFTEQGVRCAEIRRKL